MNVDGIVVDSLLDLILNAVEHGARQNMALTQVRVTQAQFDALHKECDKKCLLTQIGRGGKVMKVAGLTIEVW